MDNHPYSISNWQTYPNYPSVEETAGALSPASVMFLASHHLQLGNLHTTPNFPNEYCGAMWYHSNYIDYTSWLAVPCDGLTLLTAGVICEETTKSPLHHNQRQINFHNYYNISEPPDNKSDQPQLTNKLFIKTLHKVSQVCPPFWTFIKDLCYRILPINCTKDYILCKLSQISNSKVSDSEFIKRHVHAL